MDRSYKDKERAYVEENRSPIVGNSKSVGSPEIGKDYAEAVIGRFDEIFESLETENKTKN